MQRSRSWGSRQDTTGSRCRRSTDVFASGWVIGSAAVLYLVEFVADKIPWVDSIWDSVHTVIRPVGGALVAVATVGEQTPTVEALVALLGGTLAAGSHLTKASTRVAANASPEPFSNWILSLLEDSFVVGLGLLALKYPVAALVVTVLIAVTRLRRWSAGSLVSCGCGDAARPSHEEHASVSSRSRCCWSPR